MHYSRISTFNLTNFRSRPIVAVYDDNLGSLTNTDKLVAHCDSSPSDVSRGNIEFRQLESSVRVEMSLTMELKGEKTNLKELMENDWQLRWVRSSHCQPSGFILFETGFNPWKGFDNRMRLI